MCQIAVFSKIEITVTTINKNIEIDKNPILFDLDLPLKSRLRRLKNIGMASEKLYGCTQLPVLMSILSFFICHCNVDGVLALCICHGATMI